MAGEPVAGRILVTGGSGQVGGELIRALAPLGVVYAPGRTDLDLCDAGSIRKVMREFKPRWVVNAGAYTAVDKAESEPQLASAVNAIAPEVMAQEAKAIGAAVLHFSTDYVFDGAKESPYVESDPANPLNVYGSSKLAGEIALSNSGCAHMIFRTSWVYGSTGKNFLLSILRFAKEREHLRIVSDQRGAPTWSADLARMAAHVIAEREVIIVRDNSSLTEAVSPVAGIYHASGSGETTWYGFAARAVEELQTREPLTKLASLEAITTVEYPTPARRPLNSRLDCSKLDQVLGWRMPAWQDSLSLVLRDIAR